MEWSKVLGARSPQELEWEEWHWPKILVVAYLISFVCTLSASQSLLSIYMSIENYLDIDAPLILLMWNQSEPQTQAGPPPLLPFSVKFLHQLQTSITQSFIKLECLLKPFLRTRSHDGSTHTFRSSLRFLEVLQKGVKKMIFLAFFNHIFVYMFGLIGSVKTFSKVLGVGINVGPYMAYILYI